MSKANYASVSGIMLQRCRRHSTWADHAAALRLIELVANGGDESLQELAAARK